MYEIAHSLMGYILTKLLDTTLPSATPEINSKGIHLPIYAVEAFKFI